MLVEDVVGQDRFPQGTARRLQSGWSVRHPRATHQPKLPIEGPNVSGLGKERDLSRGSPERGFFGSPPPRLVRSLLFIVGSVRVVATVGLEEPCGRLRFGSSVAALGLLLRDVDADAASASVGLLDVEGGDEVG